MFRSKPQQLQEVEEIGSAAAFERQRCEGWFACNAVVFVCFHRDHVIWTEFDDLERACADGPKPQNPNKKKYSKNKNKN